MFIETIRITNGIPQLLSYHLKRIKNTQKFLLGTVSIQTLLLKIPDEYKTGIVKCRITYKENIQNIEWIHYQARNICSLQIIQDNHIDYSFKYQNRIELENLYKQRNHCDEIWVCQKDHLTDTSFSNVVLYDGKNYFTPKTYLLNGVQRQYLLNTGKIKEIDININELMNFNKLYLINSLLDWNNKIEISMNQIYI